MGRALECELGGMGSTPPVSLTHPQDLVFLPKINQAFFSKYSPRFSPVPVFPDTHHILVKQDGSANAIQLQVLCKVEKTQWGGCREARVYILSTFLFWREKAEVKW